MSKRHLHLLLCTLFLCLQTANVLADQKWGHLEVTLRYGGPPVKVNYLDTRNPDIKVPDERLVVNPANKGLQNVAIYLSNTKPVRVHRSYNRLIDQDVEVSLKNRRLEPHVFGVWTSQKLIFTNLDKHGYNPNLSTFKNPPVSFLIRPNVNYRHQFKIPERLPCPVFCSVHPWIRGFAVIRDHPYIGVSDKNGDIAIRNIPAGIHRFQFWHESAGYLTNVKIDGKLIQWKYGRIEIEIRPNKTTKLDVIEVPAAEFKK